MMALWAYLWVTSKGLFQSQVIGHLQHTVAFTKRKVYIAILLCICISDKL